MRFDRSSDRLPGIGRHAALAGVALAGCLASTSARAANDIEIRVRDCRSNVDVKARNVRLSDVLAQLAKALDFRIRMEGPDPWVNVSLSAPASEVVAALAAEHGSFMIQHASDSRCPGTRRVSMLWLAPQGTLAASPASPAANARTVPPKAAVAAVTEIATAEQLRRVEEDAARRKQDYEIYVRQHGKAPPGEPEEAAAP